MAAKMPRRKFLQLGATATAGLSLAATGWPPSPMRQAKQDALRVGIIGTGDRGAWIAYIMRGLPEFKLVACCDVLPAHLKEGMQHAAPGARSHEDYRRLLEDKEIEAVVIATPLHLHFQMAKDALSAGKHVFCEKTMTHDIAQALQLVQLVRHSDRVFQVGYQWQSSPLYQEIHRRLQHGDCGQVTHVRCNYHRNGNWRRPVPDPKLERLINWRMYWEYSGGLMAELCSHHINVVNWMLGSPPLKVTGLGSIDFWKDGRETFDNVCAMMEYPGGVKGIFTSITTNAHYGVAMQFMGTKGTIEVTSEEGQRAVFYAERKAVEQELSRERIPSLDVITSATRKAWARGEALPIEVERQHKDDQETSSAALLDFAECIRHGRIPRANVYTGRDAAIAVHMANAAMRNGTMEYWKPEYSA